MRRFLAASVVLAACLVGPPIGSAAAAPAQSPAGPTEMITLITGDRVLLGGAGGAAIRPAKGREKIQFRTQRDVRGDTHVTPLDAMGMLRSGHLDPRLFNVSQLVKHGFGDTARPDIPLIVGGIQSWSSVKAAKDTRFWGARTGARIWLDGPVRARLDRSVPQIGAPAAWQAGFTGKNTTVAVLDTGIDSTHPDLDDAVVGARDFTESPSGVLDKYGHGTHVASIITGRHDKYSGVAPDTKLLNGKVLNDRGSGSESGVIAGMRWAAAGGARVINMSLGSDMPSDGTDLVSQTVNTLTAETGVLFVIASGNSGETVGSPAAADAALTVGAVDRADVVAPFSSRGPRFEDNAIKPDITAPGVDIVAAKAKDSFLGRVQPNVGEHHLVMSGTSMATPHVAGAAAILAGQHPDWRAAELKAALMNSAKPNPDFTIFDQGAGRVDVGKAVAQAVTAVPASFSNGVVRWPHTDDQPITNVVTYHNSGTAPATLRFGTEMRDSAGKLAPAGMFTVSPATLAVPVGGKAQAALTIDTRVAAPDGLYSGVITAGDIRTPVSVTREQESYDAKLQFIGFDGQPTGDYAMRLVSFDNPYSYERYDGSGSLTVRLPKGRYFLEVQLFVAGHPLVVMTEPDLDVRSDVTVNLDAREAKPVGLALDRQGKTFETFVELSRTMAWGVLESAVQTELADVLVRPSRTSAPGGFRFSVGGRVAGDSYLYHVRADTDGEVPANPVARLRDRELVKIKSGHAAARPGTVGIRENVITRPLPYTLDELYSPGVGWHSWFSENTADGQFVQNTFTSTPRSFTRDGVENWNQAVFGPDLPANPLRPFRYASRSGDTLVLGIPMYSDGGVNREGFSVNTGRTELYRGAELIGAAGNAGSGLYDVPAGPATYRLHTESTRDRAATSKVVVDWMFQSDTVDDPAPKPLPLMAVRFAPRLDTANQTHRVLPSVVPITVSHNTRAAAWPTKLQVSHDKGVTWRPAPLLVINGKWFTLLSHPKGATSVSLLAYARDAAGNTVTQTIVDAFGLK